MLSGLLERLHKLLDNYRVQLDNEQIKSLADTLEFHNNGLLPANVLQRELEISYKDIHSIMSYLSTKGILVAKYKIYCENDMNTGASEIYDDIKDIPVKICDRCDRSCALIKNVIVEFEVHL